MVLLGINLSAMEPKSLQKITTVNAAKMIMDGTKTLGELKQILPNEIYERVVEQVKLNLLGIASQTSASETLEEAIQKISKFKDAIIVNDKEFTGNLIKVLAARFAMEYNKKAIRTLRPDYTQKEIVKDAPTAFILTLMLSKQPNIKSMK